MHLPVSNPSFPQSLCQNSCKDHLGGRARVLAPPSTSPRVTKGLTAPPGVGGVPGAPPEAGVLSLFRDTLPVLSIVLAAVCLVLILANWFGQVGRGYPPCVELLSQWVLEVSRILNLTSLYG